MREGRTRNSIIKGLLCKVASLIRGVQDLVVEDREVQGKTESDWVGWGQVALGDLSGTLVSQKRLIGRLLALVTKSKLGEVTVVVTLPVGPRG